MKKITLKGGIVCLAISLLSLASCKKEEITSKKSVLPNGQTESPNYKFSATAKIPGENPENGFLLLKVSSNDEAYLKEYIAKLEQTKIIMAESSTTEDREVRPLMEGNDSSTVNLDFNWDHFSFNREKGKLYQVKMASNDQSKALVYYTAYSNSGGFTSSWGYAAVNVYSTYRYWNLALFTYENMNNCEWSFHNTQSYFYTQTLSYQSNLELRCFQPNTMPYFDFIGFDYFTINDIMTYFRPRLNYVSPEMPSSYNDTNAITEAKGISKKTPGEVPSPANLTLYIAG